MKEKTSQYSIQKGLWYQIFFEDKLNSETSINKLFRYKLSPNNNLGKLISENLFFEVSEVNLPQKNCDTISHFKTILVLFSVISFKESFKMDLKRPSDINKYLGRP